METLEKDLASFARHHGRALDSDDPRAVMEAEANLAAVVNSEWLDRAGAELGIRTETTWSDKDARRRGTVADVLALKRPTEGEGAPDWELTELELASVAFLRLPESDTHDRDPSYVRWSSGALRGPSLDARNRAAASIVVTRLSTVSKFERVMESDGQDDWGLIALGFAPTLEDGLNACLFEAGRRAWHEGARLQHRFYSPILEFIFEKGGKPTLVHYEAIAYLLRRQDPSQAPLPDLGPVATRLVLTPHFRAALESYRGVRNQLAHAGRDPWDKDAYRTHCELLFGYPSASEWLDGNFAVDSTGTLGESGRNLLSSVLVNRYLHEAVEKQPDVGLTLLLAKLLSRSDLPMAWADRLLATARSRGHSGSGMVLGLVNRALETEVLSHVEFDTTWMDGLLESVSIDEAVYMVNLKSLSPLGFPSTWKRRAAERSSWRQYEALLSSGLLSPNQSDATLRRSKLSLLSLAQAQEAVLKGVHPCEFDDTWRLTIARRIDSMKIRDVIWLIENGLIGGAKPSKARVTAWSSKASRREAALLVRAGLADPSDFRPSWGPLLSAAAAQAKSE
jgi:hypothetical protein